MEKYSTVQPDNVQNDKIASADKSGEAGTFPLGASTDNNYKMLVHQKSSVPGELENASLLVRQNPLPPATEMERYDQLAPSAAER